jgi:hypothetical protein
MRVRPHRHTRSCEATCACVFVTCACVTTTCAYVQAWLARVTVDVRECLGDARVCRNDRAARGPAATTTESQRNGARGLGDGARAERRTGATEGMSADSSPPSCRCALERAEMRRELAVILHNLGHTREAMRILRADLPVFIEIKGCQA